MKIGPYEGEAAPGWDTPAGYAALANLPAHLAAGEVLSTGRNQLVRCQLTLDGQKHDVMVKVFPRPGGGLRALGWRAGKARRAWQTTCALTAAGVGTPPPVALLECRRHGLLRASYLVTAYVPNLVSLREALNRIYREQPATTILIPLLQAVADATRALHQAGWIHRDLGNQNLLLNPEHPPGAPEIIFVDLNRARRRTPSLRRIARDLSRLCLPSDFRRILHEMYFDRARPTAFRRWEACYRAAFTWHSRTRRWRHPLREAKTPRTPVYPPPREIWIWDEASAQAISAWNARDRRRLHRFRDGLTVLRASQVVAKPLRSTYRHLRSRAFHRPIALANRVGVAVQMRNGSAARELELLRELGPVPVLIRAYHHEGAIGARQCVAGIRALAAAGHAVTLALVQDRRAVRDPDDWRAFALGLLDQVAPHLEAVEMGHAINRVKWGFWNLEEYRRWCVATADLPRRYPDLQWLGPAAIDFEPHRALAFLAARPPKLHFSALSHHLYVDRRGAPENKQGKFSTLEKAALFKAMAFVTPGCGRHLVVSEFNWPLADTGIHSPVCSPYLYAGQEVATNVSEVQAAEYLVRYLLITLCSGLVERAYWWRLVARGYGLVDDTQPADWRPRPAFEALRDFLRLLGGAIFIERPATPRGVHAYVFSEGDQRHWLLYAHPRPVTYQPPVTWRSAWAFPGGALHPTTRTLKLTSTPLLLLDTTRSHSKQ